MCPNITTMSVIFHFSFLICFSNIIILTINVRMMEISSQNKTLFLAFIIHYSICLKSLAVILPSLIWRFVTKMIMVQWNLIFSFVLLSDISYNLTAFQYTIRFVYIRYWGAIFTFLRQQFHLITFLCVECHSLCIEIYSLGNTHFLIISSQGWLHLMYQYIGRVITFIPK